MKLRMAILGAAAALITIQPAWSQEPEGSMLPEVAEQPATPAPLYKGFYLAPMASYVLPYDNRGLDDGIGAALAIGYRYGALAFEAQGEYAKLDAKDAGQKSKITGGYFGLLWFPFESPKGLYATASVGRVETKNQPVGNLTFEGDSFEAGAGYLLPISFGRYEFAIRSEAKVRFSERGRPITLGDDNLPRRYQDVLLNLGLQLPFGLKPVPVVPPPAVQVVAAPPACSDSADNDGDGKIDFPNDPGCTAADDNDETDPPPPPPVCKAPLPGERISLQGCGSGDVIVLRGVNFEFDQSRLTPNAKTILDNVAAELVTYADIRIEIGGHTDARGSDEYNQRLSEARAAAVVEYLVTMGVDAGRMSAVGYGEATPVADNETDEGRELNRRVELKITEAGTSPVTAAPQETVQ